MCKNSVTLTYNKLFRMVHVFGHSFFEITFRPNYVQPCICNSACHNLWSTPDFNILFLRGFWSPTSPENFLKRFGPFSQKRKLGEILVLELREILSREKAFVDMMVYQWSKKIWCELVKGAVSFWPKCHFRRCPRCMKLFY